MWNKLVDILQQPASKRLGIAIVISTVLHTIFFGNMNFSLPTLKNEMHLIEIIAQNELLTSQILRCPDDGLGIFLGCFSALMCLVSTTCTQPEIAPIEIWNGFWRLTPHQP